MTDQTNIHWTDDEELLSAFVLHRLPQSEIDRMNLHLDSCERCRQTLSRERSLVAGIKSTGRRDVKARLASTLQESSRTKKAESVKQASAFQIPWARVASLAAVIVVLVAVGVYNDWFRANLSREPGTPLEVSKEQDRQTLEPSEKKDERAQLESSPQQKGHQAITIPERDRHDEDLSKDRLTAKQKVEEDKGYSVQFPAKSAEAPRTEGGSNLMGNEPVQSSTGAMAVDQIVIPPSQSFWVEGHVMAVESNALANDGRASSVKERAFAAPQAQSTMKKLSDKPSTETERHQQVQITLNQRPFSSLPYNLQSNKSNTAVIQTLLESRNDSLRMTLYLDSLLPEADLRSAQAETINEDSVILNISNQHIGYRLPQTLQNQVNTKARQVK